ncbi:MAG TPA: hypothetical protein PLF81_19635, partial [Candidatus Anammoximicrobium sp.]|nr:hypothetical protein [Candidatus Anammoximicrobium sp.]
MKRTGAILAFLLLLPVFSAPADDDGRAARDAMVRTQIEARGIRDPATLAAMRVVPRHRFVPPDLADSAYADQPLPIGYGQTI